MMRHPKQIADEMEKLVGFSDRKSAHGRADELLIELIEQLAPTRDRAPHVAVEVERAVRLWREAYAARCEVLDR